MQRIRMSIFALLLAFVSFPSGCHLHRADFSEEQKPEPEKDEIVISLFYTCARLPFQGEFSSGFSIPQLLVWKDGRVFYGHFEKKTEDGWYGEPENWTFSWGKTDPKNVEELVDEIRTFFHFPQAGGEIWDVPYDSPYWTLQGRAGDAIYTVNSEGHDTGANGNVLGKVNGITTPFKMANGDPYTKSELRSTWKKRLPPFAIGANPPSKKTRFLLRFS